MNFITTVLEDDIDRSNVNVRIDQGTVIIEFNRFKIYETISNKDIIVAGINKKLIELKNKVIIKDALMFKDQPIGNIYEGVEGAIMRALGELLEKEIDRNEKEKSGR